MTVDKLAHFWILVLVEQQLFCESLNLNRFCFLCLSRAIRAAIKFSGSMTHLFQFWERVKRDDRFLNEVINILQ